MARIDEKKHYFLSKCKKFAATTQNRLLSLRLANIKPPREKADTGKFVRITSNILKMME